MIAGLFDDWIRGGVISLTALYCEGFWLWMLIDCIRNEPDRTQKRTAI